MHGCGKSNYPPHNKLIDSELTEFNISVNIPDEIKSRAAATGIVGADGLYSFTREIDRLWYAVYYDGEYLFDSEQEDSPAVTKTSDGNFSVPFKFHNTMDFSKINVFFWAGNAEDNVSTNNVTSITDGINLNFAKRCVSVDPKYMNGNNTELKEFDSFSGYVQLTTSSEDKNFNKNITLYRPFAQIHILTDEFTEPGVSSDFPDGVTVVPGFGSETASSSNYSSTIVSPTTWFFDDSVDLNPGYKKNEFQFSPTSYEFTNSLTGNTPERVTFKDRTMDYMGCYYVFAPVVKAPLKLAESTGTSTTLSKVNLAFRKKGESIANSEFASVDLPSDGIKANNKYVIYNKSLADGGNGGFLSSTFVLEVVVDPIWGDHEEIQYPPYHEPTLEEIAWGIPLKETEDPNWGRVGNLALWDAYKAKIGRYLMDGTGHAAKLNPENSGLWPDGSEVDESKGNVMVIAPNLYYWVKESEEDGYPTLWMSESPISDKKIFEEQEYGVIGAYKGAIVKDILVSRSDYVPVNSKTIFELWDSSQQNGINWGLINWNHVRFINMLGLSEFGSPNIQNKMSHGIGGSSRNNWTYVRKLKTGSTISKGDNTGYLIIYPNSQYAEYSLPHTNLYGIENPYGWYSDFVQGIYFGNKNNLNQTGNEVVIYRENKLPTDNDLLDLPSSYRIINKNNKSGFTKKMFLGEYFDLIPIETTGGQGDEYWGDYTINKEDATFLTWGGSANTNNKGYPGLSCFYLRDKNYSSEDTSGRLAYYGPVTFVDAEYFK